MGAKRKARKAASRASAAESLVDLLDEVEAAVSLALATVGPDPEGGPDPVDDKEAPVRLVRRPGHPDPAADPVLLDRYQGLLVRSGMVGDSVNHLPSRLRERADLVLRDLIVGVSRDRSATTAGVDALVDELLAVVGERIAVRVGEWRTVEDPPEQARRRDRVSG